MKRALVSVAALTLLGVIGCSDASEKTLAYRDEKITADVEASLRANVPGEIQVSTRQGVVTLSGTVPDASARTHAAELAKKTAGVERVDNNLRATIAADAPAVIPPAVNLPPAPELK
jgi:osmotically-inducible protein OsmY